ncbi:MAG: NAD(P)/FAD-dependent oxidoreductase [Eubacteriales bacterium]|nr:NAD(P)/FAD-dependent oxidoreductase [Eubacteriales bacterium]
MKKKRIVIAGAGASGLTAAIMAARRGAAVTVLEQNDKPGKKICATGNGRCNLTNINMPPDAYRGTCPDFVSPALKAFSVQDTIRFFSELGIYTINKKGYLYPRSGQAQSVADVLAMEARSLGVKIKTRETVKNIVKDDVWKVQTETWVYEADAVILANGSKSSNIAGSDGSGYVLAKNLGHNIIPPLPALTPLKCKGNYYSSWAGVRTEGEITLHINDIPLKSEEGELQLTEYGISGIPVFQLSRYAVRALEENCRVTLSVDFLPEFSEEGLHAFLEQRAKNCPYKNQKELLVGLFPDKLIKVLCEQKNLEQAIKAYPLTVTGGLSFPYAQVCSGGVDTREVNAVTMESFLEKGIYFAGELLDIDGTCGGYNLQWAWSSGAVAGLSAAGEHVSDSQPDSHIHGKRD